MGRRPGRAAAKNAAAALSTFAQSTLPGASHRRKGLTSTPENTPQAFDDGEDEHMPDAPSDAGSAHEIDDDNGDEEEGTPAAESEVDEGPSTPAPQPIIRKKKLGRPPKNKPPGWDDGEEVTSETGTPRRGGRGRGGSRGGGYVQTLS